MSDASEISASFEETNRIRASMGIPLLARPAKEVAGNAAASRAEAVQTEHKRLEAETARQLAKERARKQKHASATRGPSLGKQLLEQRGSAADWVARMREKAPDAERKAALDLASSLEKSEADAQPKAYGAEDLANLRVRHDAEEFQKGQEVILTLKDEEILKVGGHEANDAEDELENLNLKDNQITKRNKERKTKKWGYNPLEENDVLLSHYDDEKDFAGDIRLDGSGSFDETHAMRLKHMQAHLEAERTNRTLYDLNTISPTDPLASLTPNADAEPRAPVSFKKRRKKKKGGNKKKGTTDTYAFLKEPSPAERSQDHGNRETLNKLRRDALEHQRKQALKDQSYMKALEKAADRQREDTALVLDEDDNDAELEAALSRARRARQSAAIKQEQGQSVRVDTAVLVQQHAETLAASSDQNVTGVKIKTEPGIAQDSKSHPQKQQLYMGVSVSRTTNFCASISLQDKKTLVLAGTQTSKDEKSHPDGSASASGAMELEENEDTSDDEDTARGNGSDSESDRDLLTEEVDLRTGMASALQLAKDRGILERKEEQAGRARDGSLFLAGDDPAPHLTLDKYDQFGRVLKPKEAFRTLSHKFHGRGPGTAKLEKAHKRFRQAQQQRYVDATFDTGTAARLKREQIRTGAAYISLDKLGKPADDLVAPTAHPKSKKRKKKAGKATVTKKAKLSFTM